MMKKYNILLLTIIVTLSSLFFSCKDDDNGNPPAPITNLTTKADYGSVILSWEIPFNDPNFYYVNIEYQNTAGEKRSKKITHFAADPVTHIASDTIDGFLDLKEYTFILTACNREGASSAPQTISETPLEPVFSIISKNVNVVPDYGGARIVWINPTGKKAEMQVTYQRDNEEEVITTIDISDPNGSYVIYGMNQPEKTYKILVKDAKGNFDSPIIFNDIDPLPEINIPKGGWSIPKYVYNQVSGIGWSSQHGGTGNQVTNVIDNNLNSFWHTRYNPVDFPPHFFIVDLGQEYTLSKVESARRRNNNQGQVGYKILTLPEGSTESDITDESKWIEQGSFMFNINSDELQSERLINNPKTRYVKYYTENCPYYFAMLAEIWFYGE